MDQKDVNDMVSDGEREDQNNKHTNDLRGIDFTDQKVMKSSDQVRMDNNDQKVIIDNNGQVNKDNNDQVRIYNIDQVRMDNIDQDRRNIQSIDKFDTVGMGERKINSLKNKDLGGNNTHNEV